VKTTIVNGIDVGAHGGLVAKLAKRYRRFIGGCLEWEDLMQAGWLGVHKAAEKFDHTRGLKFSTYAQYWIQAYVQRCVMNDRRTVRVPVHKQQDAYERGEVMPLNSASLDAPRNAHTDDPWIDTMAGSHDTEREAADNELVRLISAELARLPERNRGIIRGRFWREMTLGEIGDTEGVSRERIRQVESNTLDLLGARLSRGAR
jgi:RNA polymerase sigma factor (sigma-70 family)